MWRSARARADESLGCDAAGPIVASAGARATSSAPPAEPFVPAAQDGAGDAIIRLRRGLDEFRGAHTCSVQSAQRAITPLLDVWSLACDVDHMVARPVEVLLAALVDRCVVTAAELSHCADEVDWALSLLVA